LQKILQLELNEVNFAFVEDYCAQGKLPILAALIRRHGLIETTSERTYEELEPWIQWVSAHTGLSFAEHGVFRLGDIRERDELSQIWEVLETRGRTVAAMSPMNARNACARPTFFVPDPWTGGEVIGSALLPHLYDAIAQLVNDNAHGRVRKSSLVWLVASLLRFARAENYRLYLSISALVKRRSWARALLLDLLLADVFVGETRRTDPDFASLFLNAAAHLQHHHMFDAGVYSGPNRNPEWYGGRDEDPVLKVYELYDRLIGQIMRAFPKHRLLIATGLHQVPYPDPLYYWRLRDHDAFLRELGIAFESVEPRMSRDFLIRFSTPQGAAEAERLLSQVVANDGELLFEIDNRGDSLFVIFRYPHDIEPALGYRAGSCSFSDLRTKSAFVAIKNGEHDGIGYLIDTAEAASDCPDRIPLTSLFTRTLAHFDVLAA